MASKFTLPTLPPWVTTNLRSPASWKIWLRCWVAFFAAFVVMLPDRSLKAMGNAAFFALLTAFCATPALPVQLFLFSVLLMLAGMCVGWGIGCIAMRAALSARNQAVAQAEILRTIQGATGRVNPEAVVTLAVFHGAFLDTKSTVIYGAFLAVFSFMFGVMRAYYPRLILFATFGNIVLDIMCSYGPLFPIKQYSLPSTLLISSAIYVAIAIVCNLTIFPDNVNFRALRATETIVRGLKAYVQVQEESLEVGEEWENAAMHDGVSGGKEDGKEGGRDEGKIKREALAAKMGAMRAGVVGVSQAFPQISFLINVEFSLGMWSGGDIVSFKEYLGLCVARICGLHTFLRLIMHLDTIHIPDPSSTSPANHTSTGPPSDARDPDHKREGTATPADADPDRDGAEDIFFLRELHASPSQANLKSHLHPSQTEKILAVQSISHDPVIPLLRQASAPLRQACVDALGVAADVFASVNANRSSAAFSALFGRDTKAEKFGDVVKRLDEAVEGLEGAIRTFENEERLRFLEPFLPSPASSSSKADEGDRAGSQKKSHPPMRTLLLACTFASVLISSAHATLALLVHLQSVTAARPRRRLWAPRGMRAFGAVLKETFGGRGRKSGPAVGEDEDLDANADGVDFDDMGLGEVGGGSGETSRVGSVDEKAPVDEEPAVVKQEKPGNYQLDPDSRPPTNAVQRVMNALFSVYRWSVSPEAVFGWKYVVVTLALWLPSVIHHSAYFAYSQRGLWALIMAQTTLNVYVADQMYNSLARLAATLVGLVVGLLAWYIGNGTGNGSAYGSAASVGVFLIPIVFLRVFAPIKHIVPLIMFGATFSLVVGYSWLDGHLPLVGNPGIGWTVAWKRGVLVVIGSVASFALMLFPLRSGRVAVRERHASIISELAGLYSFLISAWIVDDLETGAPRPAEVMKVEAERGVPALTTDKGVLKAEKGVTVGGDGSANAKEKGDAPPSRPGTATGPGTRPTTANTARTSLSINTATARPGSSGTRPTSRHSRYSSKSYADPKKTPVAAPAPHAPQGWTRQFRAKIIGMASQIEGMKARVEMARWEGNLRGVWPVEEYRALVGGESDLVGGMAQLGCTLSYLPLEWRRSLKRRCRVLSPDFITDVISMYALVSHSLQTGKAMPQVLKSSLIDRLLSRTSAHHHRKPRQHHANSNNAERTDDREAEKVPDSPIPSPESLSFLSTAQARPTNEHDIELLKSLEFVHFANGIAAMYMTIISLDELHAITRRLCGEIPFHGFDEWKDEYHSRR